MALLHLKIFGKEIDDALLIELIIGAICVLILLVVMGTTSFGDWVRDSLVVYIASILFLVPFTYGFVEEGFEPKHIVMMIAGAALIVIYALTTHDVGNLGINIIKSITFATVLSLVLKPFVKHLK